MPEIKNLYAMILAGGSGTRLWPLSREEMPKQFLSLDGGELSLLQETVARLLDVTAPARMKIVAGASWRALIAHQLMKLHAGIVSDAIVEEKAARNTAPAIALGIAAFLDEGAGEEDVVLVCPSDHLIQDRVRFEDAVAAACAAAREGNIVTFGIAPTEPETGFGYIKAGWRNPGGWLAVDGFVEKPDIEKARAYLAAGNYYWNGGIFCFRIRDMIEAMEQHAPDCAAIARSSVNAREEIFLNATSRSIDYAVMEVASNVACVPMDAGWSDVGSWDAVHANLPKDETGSVVLGDALAIGGSDNLIFAQDRLVVGVDLESTIVVDTPDAVFVAPRGSSQKVRDVVKALEADGRPETRVAPISARPWGTYKILSSGDRYKIKRIEVSPGNRLSLQYHLHRSEHWVVVRGTAKVTLSCTSLGNEVSERLVHEGESFFVPKGFCHRLENPGKIPLEIVEIQIGEYLDEDDIVRLDDGYGRA